MTRVYQLAMSLQMDDNPDRIARQIQAFIDERDAYVLQDFDPRREHVTDPYEEHEKQAMVVRRLLAKAYDQDEAHQ